METFSSKLLLFGEHIVIKGARALATPYAGFHGSWQWGPEDGRLQQSLPDFLTYIKAKSVLAEVVDYETFEADLKKGLFFDSNIPTGYGLGSSGALCAAVYKRYARKTITGDNLSEVNDLQLTLARMESFFHQSSSGVDPLVCYMDCPLVLQRDQSPIVAEISITHDDAPLFLIDTQQSRRTAPHVANFLSMYERPSFRSAMESQLLPANEAAITAFLQADRISLQQAFQEISQFQFEHFRRMIPASIAPLWEQGLISKDFQLKLCGAGGGGFMLGLAKDAKTLDQLQLGISVLPTNRK